MANDGGSAITNHLVVSHEEWLAARTAFLAKEKEFSHLRDDLNRQRRELPWEPVTKTYVFDGPAGKETLADLFGPYSQLAVYHFMFNPQPDFDPDRDEGCTSCSFWADHFDGSGIHLKHRDVSFVVISRAPLAKIEAFKKRMGWNFKWVSSFQNDFNFDHQASFTPEQIRAHAALFNYSMTDPWCADREGASVFYKDPAGAIFHTYSCYARGIDLLNSTYNWLDLVPKGRDEAAGNLAWVRYHDRYED